MSLDDRSRASGVLEEANAVCGASFHLVRFLGGQAQGGWEVRDLDGRVGVLKFSAHPGWVRQARRFAGLAKHLRDKGYPAAGILHEGALPDDRYFLVQGMLPGERLDGGVPGPIASRHLQALLPFLERHAGLAPERPRGWSDYVCEVVFGEEHEWATLQDSAYREAGELLGAVRARRARLRGAELTSRDFVTATYEPANVLVTRDEVTGMCDLEAAGSGDRVIDLACILVHVDGVDEEMQVRGYASAIGRSREFEVAELYWMVNVMCGLTSSNAKIGAERWLNVCADRLQRQVAWRVTG